jgi:hypothetical protein
LKMNKSLRWSTFNSFDSSSILASFLFHSDLAYFEPLCDYSRLDSWGDACRPVPWVRRDGSWVWCPPISGPLP